MAEAEIKRKILSVGEKVILQRTVEFIEFVETEDKLRRFQCRHCGQVAILHVQLQCGHTLCQECFAILHFKRCPVNDCNEFVKEKEFDGNSLDHEIRKLKVFCKYHKCGCDDVVSLGDLLAHQRNCSFSKLSTEGIEELMKCKEEIRNLKRQFSEFQVYFQPFIPLFQEKCLMSNKEIEDSILEKVKMDSEEQKTELEKQLTETFEKYIDRKLEIEQNKMETKLLLKYENDFKNLQEKILKERNESREVIEKSVKKKTSKTLKSEIKHFRKDWRKDLLTENEELKKTLQETSKAFIEGTIEVKCEEIEKDLNHNLELKLKENFENERSNLFNEIKSEVNVKGEEVKLSAIQELNENLKKRLENEKCSLERSFNQKYELDKFKMEGDFKKEISSEIHRDIHSLYKKLDVQRPRSLKVIWEIQDIKDQLSNPLLSIESEVFHLDEIECKVKFIFCPYIMYFEVKYLDQPSDKIIPFNGHHRITFIVHDQVDNKSHNDFIRIFEPTFGAWTDGTFNPYKGETTKDDMSCLHSRWLKNEKIPVKVIVEPLNQIIALEPRLFGHVIWKIDHFKDVCESHRYTRQCSWSEAFYSSEKGYRMKGFLCIQGTVEIRLYFLKGPWDNKLPKEFKHRTMVTLISQKDPSELKDMTISKERDSAKWDPIGVLPKEYVEKYVKNDSLIISIKVEAR